MAANILIMQLQGHVPPSGGKTQIPYYVDVVLKQELELTTNVAYGPIHYLVSLIPRPFSDKTALNLCLYCCDILVD